MKNHSRLLKAFRTVGPGLCSVGHRWPTSCAQRSVAYPTAPIAFLMFSAVSVVLIICINVTDKYYGLLMVYDHPKVWDSPCQHTTAAPTIHFWEGAISEQGSKQKELVLGRGSIANRRQLWEIGRAHV